MLNLSNCDTGTCLCHKKWIQKLFSFNKLQLLVCIWSSTRNSSKTTMKAHHLLAITVLVAYLFTTTSTARLPQCRGVTNLLISVCSYHGVCIGDNTCKCTKNYYGSDCELFDCYGVQNSNKNGTCSSRGQCVGPNTCFCDYGYYGDNCTEIDTCHGIAFNNASVCSGHGACQGGTCYCTNGANNTDCSAPSNCQGVASTAGWVCSGENQGTCMNGACQCANGYGGSDCSQFNCSMIPHDNSTVCSGNGYCLLPNVCFCKEPYAGANCSMIVNQTMTTTFAVTIPSSGRRLLSIELIEVSSSSSSLNLAFVEVSILVLLLYTIIQTIHL